MNRRQEIEGAPVITMEIAGGGTLEDELRARGPLPVERAVDAMQAAGPAERHYSPGGRVLMQLLRELLGRTDLGSVSIAKPGFSLELA